MTKSLRVGLVGLGYIGKIHTAAYRNIPLCFREPPLIADLVGVLRSKLNTETDFMSNVGFDLATTDPDEFFAQKYDVVDVCSPNYLHREHVQRALKAGAHVYCEKPMACSLEDARAMAEMAKEYGRKTQVAFVMRYIPAIRQMKTIIEAGVIGEIFNFRAHMFHGSYIDPNRLMSWRLRDAQSGGGAFADLGAHLVDMSRYLLGDVLSVRAETRTFITQRKTSKESDQLEEVDVDDWTLANLKMKGGSVGAVEVTRMAAGAGEETKVEVFGSKGALDFRISNPYAVRIFDVKRKQWYSGALDVPMPEGERPLSQIWPSGKYSQGVMSDVHIAGAYDFLLNIAEGKSSPIDFDAGAATQEVIEAVYRSAAHGGEKVCLPL